MLNWWLTGGGYPNDYAIYRLSRMHRITYDYLYLGDWSQLPATLAMKLAPDLSQPMDPELLREDGKNPGTRSDTR